MGNEMHHIHNLEGLRKAQKDYGNPQVIVVGLEDFLGLRFLVSRDDWCWYQGQRAFWFDGSIITYNPVAACSLNLTGVKPEIEEMGE